MPVPSHRLQVPRRPATWVEPDAGGGGILAWVEGPAPATPFTPASLPSVPYRDGNWQPPEFGVDVEPLDASTTLLVPRGDLDIATTPALENAFREQLDGGGARIVLDLSGVPFIDSTGMAAIAGPRPPRVRRSCASPSGRWPRGSARPRSCSAS